ncbi:MAG TPA: PSD1 and planctomycete cytochrome C domain-containing protein [Fimbriiglobus sp.]|nr:PSD1 and planctomycete cytochrome C domain-containing protein [Fimbriiglobus sp.]
MPFAALRLPVLTALAVGLFGRATAADKPPTPEQVRFFESRVRPVLVEHCTKCHGEKTQRSELRLDSAAAMKEGGASGEPLLGEPAKSMLLRAVRHDADVAPMPPKGKKLSDAQIADLAQWVKMGAPYPAVVLKTHDRDHWAFRPVTRPAVPIVTDPAFPVRNPIDAFVLAKLRAAGLTPAAPADKRTLIRRVTFDLTGLPPTPTEIDAFLRDDSPGAYATVVERLLASPAYGERWGRHWLDVARYADSNGLDENIAHGNAWRYRDYVVQSFNADVPYNQFVREQVAGDLMPAADATTRHRQLIATGFLSLGPKVLAEPDKRKMELDIVDEQLDTTCRAILGLTMGCARCHDHKFDPITAADYYALAGIFLSTKTMDSFKTIASWHENEVATPAELKCRADHEAEVARFKWQLMALHWRKATSAVKSARRCAAEAIAQLEKNAPEVSSAMGLTEGKVVDSPILRRGSYLSPGPVVARRFPTVLAGEGQPPLPKDHSGRLQLARWLTDPANPLTARVMVNRVWRWHFGRGIVGSVDNFGLLGEKPTHPELLDWLATEFVANGWSVKHLHRLIVLSSTYRMSSAHDSKAAEADPANRLLWRANVRRVEAEVIRDSLLAVAGELDRTMGGPALHHVKNRAFLFDHTSKDLTTYDSKRRSLYLPVVRNHLYDVFQLFDAPDAAVIHGDRATTTVATQALFWMNSPLVMSTADDLAETLLGRTDLDDAGRVRTLYETAYGRPPTAKETARALASVAEFEAALAATVPESGKRRQRAWSLVCHVVLAANEFVYVR